MNLYRNGFVVATIDPDQFSYHAWPLFDLDDDRNAQKLTDEAWDRWFSKYDMQHIVPDLNYVKKYFAYCKCIHLEVEILLFETPYDIITVAEEFKIDKVLGYDCIGTVYYSYLREECEYHRADLEAELAEQGIRLNEYGLFDKIEDVMFFAGLRKKAVSLGLNVENFWEAIPARISKI